MIRNNWKKMIICGSSINFYKYSIFELKTSYTSNTSRESNNLYCKRSKSKIYYTNNHKINCGYDQD